MRTRAISLVMVAATSSLTAACRSSSSDASTDEAWGAQAVAFLGAESAAWSDDPDPFEATRYYAYDLVVGVGGSAPTRSLAEIMVDLAARPFRKGGSAHWPLPPTAGSQHRRIDEVYLSASGALTVESWSIDAGAGLGVTSPPIAGRFVVIRDVDNQGIRAIRGFAALDMPDQAAADFRISTGFLGLTPAVRAAAASWLDPMVAEYVAAWRRRDPGMVPLAGDVYIAGAPHDIADGTGAAVVVFFQVTQPDGCVLRSAQEWQVEQRRIVAERPWLEVTSVRACVPTTRQPDGWWIDRPTLARVHDRATGDVQLSDGWKIELVSADRALERLVLWGVGQFGRAGLDVPHPDVVVFPPSPVCGQAAGGVQSNSFGTTVTVCVARDDVEQPSARLLVLHELAHVWTLEHLDDAIEERYVHRAELPGWSEADIPYERRGAEHAANTIAWGLLGERHERYPNLPTPGCGELALRFTLLTGVPPLSACPA